MVGGGIVCGDWGMSTLGLDFKEVVLTSPPELGHCGGGATFLAVGFKWVATLPVSMKEFLI